MLDRIHEMKIPAKSHASVLADAYVAKIRKKMGPVATTVVTENDEERTRIVTKDKVEELNRHAEEERARREAVEKERARREEERARRDAARPDAVPAPDEGGSRFAHAAKQPPAPESPFQSLANQIEDAKERTRREAAEARARARAEAAAKEVAKKQAVEAALRERAGGRKSSARPVVETPQRRRQQLRPLFLASYMAWSA